MVETRRSGHGSDALNEPIWLPLTPQQARWLHLDNRYGTASCQITVRLRLRGRLDRQALRVAFDRVMDRQPVLRTRIAVAGEAARQYIVPLEEKGVLKECEVEGRWAAEQFCRLEAQDPLRLNAGPLVRARLLQLPDREYVLVLVLHPIICDRASVRYLLREVLALYRAAIVEGEDVELPPIWNRHRDYVLAEHLRGSAEMSDSERAYWRKVLSGSGDTFLNLTTGLRRERITGQTRQMSKLFPRELVRKLAERYRVSPCAVCASVWAAVLLKWLGRSHTVVGVECPALGSEGELPPVGPLRTLIPIHVETGVNVTAEALLRDVSRSVDECERHIRFGAWEDLLEIHPGGDSCSPVMPCALSSMEGSDIEELRALRVPGLTIDEVSTDFHWPCAVLSAAIDNLADPSSMVVTYSTGTADERAIESVGECWQAVLQGMSRDSTRRVSTLPLLSESGLERVVRTINDAGRDISSGRVVHGLLEAQARKSPDAIAVEHDGRRLTYQQLNARANQLARFLVNQGIRPGRIVGVCVDRGFEMLISILGILKAGGAYLPLDPSYPCARLRQMLDDAAPHLLITETELVGVLPSGQVKVIAIDQKLAQIGSFICDDLETEGPSVDDESLVYVIYTSGSTGKPKGIAMPHRAMTNLIDWHRKAFGTGDGCRVLQFAALSFDVAFQEIFTTLCTGGTLVLLDEWIRRDVSALLEFLNRESIHRIFLPPAMLHSLAEYCQATGGLPEALQDAITAGEQLRVTPVTRALFRRLPSCRLHNHYGPSETHVVTSFTLSGGEGEWPDLPPIGHPIPNTQVYVLDGDGRPVPVGMPGEIYIGGAAVARGYLNQPELTQERFVVDPYHSDPPTRLYKTGDIARWRSNGVLEFLGRNDDQIKIRGYRIETAEIEAQLGRHEQVKEVVVMAREDLPGEKRVVAYVTARERQSPSGAHLRAYLTSALPDYMIPSAFIVMDRLPLTATGKVDRRALPPPDADLLSSSQFEPPRSGLEAQVAVVWQEVLHVERVGRQDDFFELGGHSLLAVQLMTRLRLLNIFAAAASIYSHPTLAEFAVTLTTKAAEIADTPPNRIPANCERICPDMLPLVELQAEHIEEIVSTVSGGAKNVQDVYPLSPLQEGMLFHHLLSEDGPDTYVVPMLFSLTSRETLERFTEALQEVVRRHDILRTAILWQGLPQPVQVVYRKVELPVEQFALDCAEDPMRQLLHRMKPKAQRLDLRRAPLMRLQIAEDPSRQRWFAVLQLHHLIGDHQAEALLLNEVSAVMDGNMQDLPAPAQYREHVGRSLSATRFEDLRAYFAERLGDVCEPTAPFGITDVYREGGDLSEVRSVVARELARRIRREARRIRVSAAALFHAAWSVMLSGICGRDDVVFGTLLVGRTEMEARDGQSLGLFINTLPVRVRMADISARQLVEEVHRDLGELLLREQASLAVAQRASGVRGSDPLFTTLLNYRYASQSSDRVRWKNSGFELLEVHEWTNYPIVLSVDDDTEGFGLTLQTDQRIDPQRMLSYLRTALESLMDALERNPSPAALSLQVLPEQERRKVIEEFNPKRTYPQDSLIHELFEAQARLRPHGVAVSFEGESLTYGELNARANQLAWYLRQQGVGPDQLVGVCLERGLELVIGLLGVLKAGGAYLPLDPAYPSERLAYMLDDAVPPVLLTQQRLKDRLPGTSAKVVALDIDWRVIGKCGTSNLALRPLGLSADRLAYVIYTSGSTGRPKGVMVEHRNVVRLFAATERWFGFGARDVWTLFHSFAFDFSVWELWGALLNGGRVVIVSQSTARSPREFYRLVCQEGVTVLNQTPSAFVQLIEANAQCTDQTHALRFVIFGGEALEFRTLRPWVQRNGIDRPQLINMYGITETTVHVTYRPLSREEIESERGSIVGKPIPDLRVYLLDRWARPAPIGVAGEIYVGGAGVARGYLNRPELTGERFLRDPFSAEPIARMYKSGDLGRWRPDGTIEYLGRNDDQVKIRGFRIELGEIEAQLAGHPGVKEAVVIARQDLPGEKCLVAYVTPSAASTTPRVESLRECLKTALPEYMVPSAFVLLDSFPLTANGKLDRLALPLPDLASYVSRDYQPPKGQVEEGLAEIWCKLLRIDRIGRHDNFFELGGNSLVATRVITHVTYRFDLELPIRVIFEKPTLTELARFISDEISTEDLQEAS